MNGISFTVQPGQIFGLLGPNGAGKTTAVSIISTLLRAYGGSVVVGGNDVARHPVRARRLLGLVPQDIGLYPLLNARENVEYFGAIQGLHGADLRRRVEEALDIAGLQDFANKPRVRYFSGGMLRRLNLATGLVHNPRLLILDEATAGVDAQSRNLILDNVKRLSRESGMAVVYTTHYMEEAETLCDIVAIMDHGRILAHGNVQQLVTSASGTTIDVTLTLPAPEFATALASAPGVTEVVAHDELRYAIQALDQARGLAALISVAGQHGIMFETLRIVPPSLEQVFLSLTGRETRDRSEQ